MLGNVTVLRNGVNDFHSRRGHFVRPHLPISIKCPSLIWSGGSGSRPDQSRELSRTQVRRCKGQLPLRSADPNIWGWVLTVLRMDLSLSLSRSDFRYVGNCADNWGSLFALTHLCNDGTPEGHFCRQGQAGIQTVTQGLRFLRHIEDRHWDTAVQEWGYSVERERNSPK